MTLYILLPAYNEEAAIPLVLRAIAAAAPAWGCDWRVLLVEDGSSDATTERAREALDETRLSVRRHPRNLGLPAALRTGIEAVCKMASPADVLVTMDADDTHDPALIGEMLRRLADGADVVVASRFVEGGGGIGIPPARRLLSEAARAYLRLLFPIEGLREYTCCFRAVRVSLYQRALRHYGERFIRSRSFAVSPEILLRLRRFTPAVAEVPLVVRYDRKPGPSKIRIGPAILGYLRLARDLWEVSDH